jgi:Domain of Unknown Function (DUF326)
MIIREERDIIGGDSQIWRRIMPTRARTMREQASQIEECIQSCLDCHRICLEAITHCLLRGGEYASEKRILLLQDCAEVCDMAANFMTRNSDLHATICRTCAEVCLRCAEECERFRDDDLLKACAKACRRCAEYCQLMVANAIEVNKT